MDKLQAVVDGIIIFTIIWGIGSFIKFFMMAYQYVTCNPHMG